MGGQAAKEGQVFVGEVLPSRHHVVCTKVSGVIYQFNLQFGNLWQPLSSSKPRISEMFH